MGHLIWPSMGHKWTGSGPEAERKWNAKNLIIKVNKAYGLKTTAILHWVTGSYFIIVPSSLSRTTFANRSHDLRMKKKVSAIIADYARQIHQFLIKEDPFKQTIVSHETTNPWNRESESFVHVDRVFRTKWFTYKLSYQI